MPIPDKPVKYYEQNLLDHAIDQVVSQKDEPTAADFNKVYVAAQVQAGIDKYRAQASSMSSKELQLEKHNSTVLGRHLESVGNKRPVRCHAHAIVAGGHTRAAILRAIMARLKIRIDDPDNGCWLPENTAATPHPVMPRAVPHSRIHRNNYFFWLYSRLQGVSQEASFRINLKLIAKHLHEHTFPEYVMLKKGAGLSGGRRMT